MNKIIQLNSKFCKLEGYENCPDFLSDLDNELRYFNDNAVYGKAYSGYVGKGGKFVKWNGFTNLLKPNLTFPSGLLSRVLKFHKSNNIDYTIEDLRINKVSNNELDISHNLQKLNITPFYYQTDTVNTAINYDRGILRLATSAGKSLISVLLAAKLNKKTTIIVTSKSLLYQFYDDYVKFFDEEIGLIGDGIVNPKRITIATMQTLGIACGAKKNELTDDEGHTDKEKSINFQKYIEIIKCIKDTNVWIIDECHSAKCDLINRIYNKMNDNFDHLFGMSATPFSKPKLVRKNKYHSEDLLVESILGEKLVDIPASKLIAEGYLVQPIINFYNVPAFDYKIEKNYQIEYKEYIVENEIRNKLIIEKTKFLLEKGYQVLVLFSKIKHGKILSDMLKENNIDHAFLSGKDSQEIREGVKKDLLEHKKNCILASQIYDIGVNIVSLSALVLAAPSKSYTKTLQRVGRIVRKYEGKKFAAVVDFFDAAYYVKQHAEIRYKIYTSEPGFIVNLPKNIKIK